MIYINDHIIDKQRILYFIQKGNKIKAIKFIKTKTGLSLKDCKTIVDNLALNPSYYDDKNIVKPITTRFKNDLKSVKRTRGKHFISDHTSNYKNYIILILIAIIVFLLYIFI
ncbi:hypothetical protein HNV08_01615 [Winogradskyella eckloniae]|uniref:hypothetical protein n=1 Tax=Winogradskyella eckloniae TaxID=1089306 RepID=UPI001567778B|nr:hypothetical protein [Winogradskyella eckloniae]NRD18729.1 hypothetical protein [Winogradskyella eckloniae]